MNEACTAVNGHENRLEAFNHRAKLRSCRALPGGALIDELDQHDRVVDHDAGEQDRADQDYHADRRRGEREDDACTMPTAP